MGRPGQNRRDFADDIFKCISWTKMFLFWLKFHWIIVPKRPIDHKSMMTQVIAWPRTGDEPLLNQCWPSSVTSFGNTRPQWVDKSNSENKWRDTERYGHYTGHKWEAKKLILFRPSDAYMRQWDKPSLVPIMVCRLIRTKPLSAPVLIYC